jgi:ribosomal protein S18 acetylase RimI-like enzyme
MMKMKPLDVEIGKVTDQNVMQLKTINNSTLPLQYTDRFYRELIGKYSADYMRFAVWNGFAVAAICARIEPHEKEGLCKLYIMTMNVLAPYRRRGIAAALLDHIMEEAKKDETIAEVYLHVQTSNKAAKGLYESQGFEEMGIVQDYYRRIEPPHAYIFRKVLKEGCASDYSREVMETVEQEEDMLAPAT